MSQPGNLKNRTEKHTGRETAIRGNFRAAAAKNTAGEEAATYTVMMPDWAPRSFGVWPSHRCFVMQTHFGGHTSDGVLTTLSTRMRSARSPTGRSM